MKKKYITPVISKFSFHVETSMMVGSVSRIQNSYNEDDEQLSKGNSIWDSEDDSSEDSWL